MLLSGRGSAEVAATPSWRRHHTGDAPGVGERDAAEHAGPTALQHQVRAQLYGKALAVGPEATPAELWEKITALATDPA